MKYVFVEWITVVIGVASSFQVSNGVGKRCHKVGVFSHGVVIIGRGVAIFSHGVAMFSRAVVILSRGVISHGEVISY